MCFQLIHLGWSDLIILVSHFQHFSHDFNGLVNSYAIAVDDGVEAGFEDLLILVAILSIEGAEFLPEVAEFLGL